MSVFVAPATGSLLLEDGCTILPGRLLKLILEIQVPGEEEHALQRSHEYICTVKQPLVEEFFLNVYKVHAAGLYQLGAYFLFLFVSPRGLSLRPRRCIFKRNSISMDCFHKLSRPHYNLSWPLYLVHLGSTELDPPLSSKLST